MTRWDVDRTQVAGWFPRLLDPQVEAFVENDPRLIALYRAGDGAALRRVARALRADDPSPSDGAMLDRLLADARVFGTPIRVTTQTVRWWGTGVWLHGRDAFDRRDGTFLIDLYLTLYFVPLAPLARYLATEPPRGRAYLLRRVPMTWVHRVWLSVVSAVVAVTAAFLLLHVVDRVTHCEVHLLNGLDSPVRVVLGDHELLVPANGHRVVRPENGRYTVRAETPEGRELERHRLQLRTRDDAAIYNVLGATAVIRLTAQGAAEQPGTVTETPYTVNWFTKNVRGVDYVFERLPVGFTEPPSSDGAREEWSRSAIRVVPGGWRRAAELLAETGGKPTRGAALALRVARAFPDDDEIVRSAREFVWRLGDDAQRAQFTEALGIEAR